MSHYEECPRSGSKSRAACVCPLIDRVLTNALNRYKAIDLSAFPYITRDPDFRVIVRAIATAIRPEVL